MNIYHLSRKWWDWSFENPERVRPIHSAILFMAIEHCNRMGWKKNFGFPTTMVMEAIGVSNYKTYKKALDELVEFGFIQMVERSRNQYSANIIALVNFAEASGEAHGKALSKHMAKQVQSTASIDIQDYKNTGITESTSVSGFVPPTLEECVQASLMSGFSRELGEAYFHMRNSTNWMVARGKAGNLFPVGNWRSDLFNAVHKGYLERDLRSKSKTPHLDTLDDKPF